MVVGDHTTLLDFKRHFETPPVLRVLVVTSPRKFEVILKNPWGQDSRFPQTCFCSNYECKGS